MKTSPSTFKLNFLYDGLWLTVVDTSRAYKSHWSSSYDLGNQIALAIRFFLYCLLLIAVACASKSNSNKQSSNRQSTNTPASPPSKESTHRGLTVPQSGTPGERIRKLWAESKLVIKADAEAKLSEAEYQARRGPLFRAWLDLQSQLSLLGRADGIMGERTASEVLALINRVYGYPGYTETDRQQRRRNTNVMKELLELDRRIKTLP
jgi:hypothetical protein